MPYSQVLEVGEIFKGFFVDVGQTFCITYFSERKMHLLKKRRISARECAVATLKPQNRMKPRANVEAKWKPGGDGQDQKSPIRLLLACSGLARTPLSAVGARVALRNMRSRLSTHTWRSRRTRGGQLKRGVGGVHHPLLLLLYDCRCSQRAVLWSINHYLYTCIAAL